MRLIAILAAAAALGAGGCTSDTALGDPVAPAAGSSDGSVPPLGHGGPLDARPHPAAATRGSSSGMAGAGDAGASGTLSRPIDPSENTGFAPDAPAPGGAPSAVVDGAPIAFDGDTAGTDRDRQLNQRIRLTLADDRELAAAVTSLRLVTVDGVVTLQGQIATNEGKERLEQVVASEEGVKKVQNHVSVGAQ